MSQIQSNKIFVFLAIFFIIYFAKELVLPIFLAFLLYFLLFRIVNFLKTQFFIPKFLGSALVILIFFTVFGIGLYYLFVNLKNLVFDLTNSTDIFQSKLDSFLRYFKIPHSILDVFKDLTITLEEKIQQDWIISLFSSTWQFFAGFVMIAILLYFLLISEGLFLKKMLKSLPTLERDEKINRIIQKLEQDMANYLVTKTLINVVVGILIGAVLSIFKIPNAILLGVLVGILEFIPFLGSIVSMALITLIAIASLEQTWQIILCVSLVLIIMNVEGNILTPYVIGKRFSLNKVAVILGIYLMGWVWGIIGPFLAVPIMLIVKIIMDNINKSNVYSEIISE